MAMRHYAQHVRQLCARLLDQLTPHEADALSYCARACEDGAALLEEAL
jgi:hypothetical protein